MADVRYGASAIPNTCMMEKIFFLVAVLACTTSGKAQNPNFQIKKTAVTYESELDQYIFQIKTGGNIPFFDQIV